MSIQYTKLETKIKDTLEKSSEYKKVTETNSSLIIFSFGQRIEDDDVLRILGRYANATSVWVTQNNELVIRIYRCLLEYFQ